MSGSGKTHPFHILEQSPWPALGSLGALVMAYGGVDIMHDQGNTIFFVGLVIVLLTMGLWWRDVVMESIRDRAHTKPVIFGLKAGMAMFIASEVMFFVAFFWSYFWNLFEFSPIIEAWPPADVEVFNPWGLPFINTIILVTSGFVLMWARSGLHKGNRRQLAYGLGITVVLGFGFVILQAIEYSHAAFGFTEGIFPSVFYMATGFHGFHVLVGAVFLAVCFLRVLNGQMTAEKHVGLEAAEWYWHFVDVVWLFLFFWFYFWIAP
ncbi:MAG: cytochrome c oxidase subunit 3 [Magnetospiraceae bacterium]